jgi:hypothetical protein
MWSDLFPAQRLLTPPEQALVLAIMTARPHTPSSSVWLLLPAQVGGLALELDPLRTISVIQLHGAHTPSMPCATTCATTKRCLLGLKSRRDRGEFVRWVDGSDPAPCCFAS